MADLRKDSGVSLTSFFERCKLPIDVKAACDAFVASRFSEPVTPALFQGYCSYTLFVGRDVVVQFRPRAHKLDLSVTAMASKVFGDLAPETEYLGKPDDVDLLAFSMRRIPGMSLASSRTGNDFCLEHRTRNEQIVRDFAHFQTRSWANSRKPEDIVVKRTVGSSLRWRLELMASKLPSRFRSTTKSVLNELSSIEALPWILSHGDFLPANVMVCPSSGRLLGLLDWAEAEHLPFGVGMYGLEELLGEDRLGEFRYFPEAKHLRGLFWKELLLDIPELAHDTKRLALMRKAQILGILLWHGIAFDDGKLNRVVEEGRDDEEIHKLDMFLLSPLGVEAFPTYLLSKSVKISITQGYARLSKETRRLMNAKVIR